MKLVSYYTSSHKILYDNYFLPSIKSDFGFELISKEGIQLSESGSFDSSGFNESTSDKINFLIEVLENTPKFDNLIFCDVDLVFIKNPIDYLKDFLDYDMVFQYGYSDLNTGFFLLKNKDKVKELLINVRDNCHLFLHDQDALNFFIKKTSLKYTTFDNQISCTATFNGTNIWGGEEFKVNYLPIVFHACWTIGVENKIKLLEKIKNYSLSFTN